MGTDEIIEEWRVEGWREFVKDFSKDQYRAWLDTNFRSAEIKCKVLDSIMGCPKYFDVPESPYETRLEYLLEMVSSGEWKYATLIKSRLKNIKNLNSDDMEKCPSWDSSFMTIAKEFAKHSKCKKRKVGAVLVKDKRVISSGYNGTPAGMENCSDHFRNIDITTPIGRKLHHEFSDKYELHAECNCISYAIRSGAKIDDDVVMYVTTACCINCAKIIVSSGIKKVVYLDEYKNSDGIDFLKSAGVEVVKLED